MDASRQIQIRPWVWKQGWPKKGAKRRDLVPIEQVDPDLILRDDVVEGRIDLVVGGVTVLGNQDWGYFEDWLDALITLARAVRDGESEVHVSIGGQGITLAAQRVGTTTNAVLSAQVGSDPEVRAEVHIPTLIRVLIETLDSCSSFVPTLGKYAKEADALRQGGSHPRTPVPKKRHG